MQRRRIIIKIRTNIKIENITKIVRPRWDFIEETKIQKTKISKQTKIVSI